MHQGDEEYNKYDALLSYPTDSACDMQVLSSQI